MHTLSCFQQSDYKEQQLSFVIIPSVGMVYSHYGNDLFPPWESIIPTVGTSPNSYCHAAAIRIMNAMRIPFRFHVSIGYDSSVIVQFLYQINANYYN